MFSPLTDLTVDIWVLKAVYIKSLITSFIQ